MGTARQTARLYWEGLMDRTTEILLEAFKTIAQGYEASPFVFYRCAGEVLSRAVALAENNIAIDEEEASALLDECRERF